MPALSLIFSEMWLLLINKKKIFSREKILLVK